MQTVDRLLFAPPPAPGLLRSMVLAILAHALLLAALTWGVSWHRGETVTAEAELWAAVPQEAAPPAPEPLPEPVATLPPPPQAAPVVSDADIAIAREKQRKLEEQLAQEKLAAQKKLEQEMQAAEDKKKKEKIKAQEEAKQMEKQRQENIRRMSGLAGATGAPTSTGTALRSAGPSSSYAGRIRARIKPNIVFTEDIVGNPSAEVEVRTSPDGTIVGRKLLKSSNSRGWDEAVIKAIDKTEVLPRDIDGTMPPVLVITFRPRD